MSKISNRNNSFVNLEAGPHINSSSSVLEAGPGLPNNSSFVNLEMGPQQNTSGNSVVHQSSSMMDTLHPSDLALSEGETTRDYRSFPTLTSNGSFQDLTTSGTPNITGTTNRDKSSSVENVSGLTLPSQSMSLSNSSNPEQEPPFNASFSTIGSQEIDNNNNNSSIVGNPTGVNMIQHTPRSASSPYNSNNNNTLGLGSNNNNTLGGKKKRKNKKVNRKQKKTKKVKRKVKKTMKKNREKLKEK